jgi:hypothetical protein
MTKRRKPYTLLTPDERRAYHREWRRRHGKLKAEFDKADLLAILRELNGEKRSVQ